MENLKVLIGYFSKVRVVVMVTVREEQWFRRFPGFRLLSVKRSYYGRKTIFLCKVVALSIVEQLEKVNSSSSNSIW